jgi:hypothetical protein
VIVVIRAAVRFLRCVSGQNFQRALLLFGRLSSYVSTHFATSGSAFLSVSLTSSLEVFGNAADTSTLRTAVCCLFFLFWRTLLISHTSASDVFRPARDPCCPRIHHPFNSPLVDRCKVYNISTSYAIIGRREMHREDLIQVRSLDLCFRITITLASLSSGGNPVRMRSLIQLQSPFGSHNNQIYTSCEPIPSRPGVEGLLVVLTSRFSILGPTFKLCPTSESIL